LSWQKFEPTEGNFNFENDDAKELESYINNQENPNLKVHVSIITNSKWATYKRKEDSATFSPKDLQANYDQNYGYSKTYYNFVKTVVEHYKNDLETISIGNEVIADKFWLGNPNKPNDKAKDYLKVLITAKKAIHDVKPNIEVTDAALFHGQVYELAIYHYCQTGKTQKAQELYKNSNVKNLYDPQVPACQRVTESFFNKNPNNKKAFQMAVLGLKGLGEECPLQGKCTIYDIEDATNFHHYDYSDSLIPIVEYLKDVSSGKPVMLNETGFSDNAVSSCGNDFGAKYMARKLATAVYLKIKPVIWYTRPGEGHETCGNLVDNNGNPKETNRTAFKLALKYLNKNFSKISAVTTDNKVERYSFVSNDGKVDVAWKKDGVSRTPSIQIPSGCKAINYKGETIKEGGSDSSVSLEAPIYIDCLGSYQDKTCSDSTKYNQCSSNKPQYCDNGNLVAKCSQCGCPDNKKCKNDGTCAGTEPDKKTYNLNDVKKLFADWHGSDSPADVNNDKKVNTQDLGIMMSNWEGSSSGNKCNCKKGEKCILGRCMSLDLDNILGRKTGIPGCDNCKENEICVNDSICINKDDIK